MPIGVFDSGLGGLSVLRLLPAALPGRSFVYVADTARAPYGGRAQEEIRSYSEEIADVLFGKLGCDALVIACNTATAASAKTLRARYPDVPIIGMEPAVKPAAEATQTGVVGVMATAATIGSEKYGKLLREYGRDITVVEDPSEGLVELIEAGETGQRLTAKLEAITAPMLAAGADTIVLGCTHFPLVRNELQRVVGEGVTLIDPAPAVVREVVRRLVASGQTGRVGHAAAPESADPCSEHRTADLLRLAGQGVHPFSSAGGYRRARHIFLTSGEVGRFQELVTRVVPEMAAGAEFGVLWEYTPPSPAGGGG